ncbi:hypothetical protein ACM55F_10170 [Flavobacterium sp. XS2P12]|uniref:hypothetical protein n=1 Tax=Flavobacterium melibiosi TaxID=3398734 RepID=UPI003A83581D
MKRIIFSAVLLASISGFAQETASVNVSANAATASVTLNEGSIIKVALNDDISGKEVSVGQKINFSLSEDIIQGNYIVLRKGLKVVGTVTEAAKSKGLGKKGKLSFSIDYLYLENGKVVKLRSDITKKLNGSGALVATTAVLLTPLALFVKGKNAKYEKGEVFEAYVDENTTI